MASSGCLGIDHASLGVSPLACAEMVEKKPALGRRTSYVYGLPPLATGMGCFLMAMGYGIDIGERRGCAFSVPM